MLETDSAASPADLPELESVENRDYAAVPILVCGGGLTLFCAMAAVWILIGFRQYVYGAGLYACFAVLVLTAYLLVRFISGDTYYRTDSNGLTARGLLRRRFVSWFDVRSAAIIKTRAGNTIVKLTTSSGTLKVYPCGLGNTTSGDAITASIWQHLRKIGKVDGIDLPESARGFWKEVPMETPRELDWGERASQSQMVLFVICLVIFIGPLAGLWIAEPPRHIPGAIFMVFLSVICIALVKMMASEVLYLARSVSVREDCIEAQLPRGKACIAWSDINQVLWGREYLRLISQSRHSEIRVPYTLGKRESEQLGLAIIRHLRETGIAMALPEAVSVDPKCLQRAVFTGEALGQLQRAFLNTLEEPARKRISALRNLQLLSPLIGMGVGVWIAFANITGRLSQYLYAVPGTRFFFAIDGIVVGAPLMFVLMGVFAWAADRIGTHFAGPYSEEWREFQKVGSNPKLEWIVKITVVIIAAITLFCIPLSIDSYIRVTDDGVAISRFWSWGEQFYKWSEVRGVESHRSEAVNDGRVCVRYRYTLRFSDGTNWSASDDFASRGRMPEFEQAMSFIAEKSGKGLEYK